MNDPTGSYIEPDQPGTTHVRERLGNSGTLHYDVVYECCEQEIEPNHITRESAEDVAKAHICKDLVEFMATRSTEAAQRYAGDDAPIGNVADALAMTFGYVLNTGKKQPLPHGHSAERYLMSLVKWFDAHPGTDRKISRDLRVEQAVQYLGEV